VTFAGERGGYGNLIVIQHQDGVETRYAHLAATGVREGDSVAAGQVIGRVGSTGRSTGPHLHFEVLVDGARVDPEVATARDFSGFKFVRAAVD
jgi:murein DD-endopeptidase MepM/ murein hydrolase activator NlpD